MKPLFWTPDLVQGLRQMWPHYRAKDIGAILGCSYCAVIGKANRLGLPPIPRSVINARMSEGHREHYGTV